MFNKAGENYRWKEVVYCRSFSPWLPGLNVKIGTSLGRGKHSASPPSVQENPGKFRAATQRLLPTP
ncbi:hypothetical protein FH5T_19935 [Draconibacterium orientale]|uniref:Uncharacterized protein n=1 Tax=Draconibacterium orientale TaxID=1168034 RepID=A0ABM5QFG8_9BACT|nr:hypothetical protein FH5T_03730 [Draconibacterium orientale]AHW62344.1 hypothetical protein FH5T_19935 [Draconibacterium orientale]